MLSTIRARMAANKMYGDAIWMVLLSPLTLLSTVGVAADVFHNIWLGLALGLVMTLPLLWRRTRAEAAAAVVVFGHVIQVMITETQLPANIIAPIMLYAAVRYGERRRSRLWLAIGVVGSMLGGIRWGLWQYGLGTGNRLFTTLMAIFFWTALNLAIMVATWFSAQWSRQREDNLVSLQQRADALERERDKAIALAAEEERSRIAREMHDIVAHSLSVIVVQSDGAGYLANHAEVGDAEMRLAQVSKAIETINESARQALQETRRLVGVLRHDGDVAELAPAATLDQIGELVSQLDQAGVPASFDLVGSPDVHPPLSQGAQMAVYRVVQESLTNVMKHAGPGATVRVRLGHRVDGVELQVLDTGKGATETDGAGHGVIGMRERITAYGGQLVARPRLDGGFEVRAFVPIDGEPTRPLARPEATLVDPFTRG